MINGQDVPQKVMNEATKPLRRRPQRLSLILLTASPTPMCMQDGLNVKLTLIAEMVIYGSEIRTRPVADRANSRCVEPLLRELFPRGLNEANLGRVLAI
jgi:hypothetical protein